ncbi:MAG: hypothetical protein C5B54_07315 [Acidobacteria bacterium]|nr:MAG: hypothetical protein C5B54_07315 [Acidobacteriota bacterium]
MKIVTILLLLVSFYGCATVSTLGTKTDKKVTITVTDDGSDGFITEAVPAHVRIKPGAKMHFKVVNDTEATNISKVEVKNFVCKADGDTLPFDGEANDQSFTFNGVRVTGESSRKSKGVQNKDGKTFEYIVHVEMEKGKNPGDLDPYMIISQKP